MEEWCVAMYLTELPDYSASQYLVSRTRLLSLTLHLVHEAVQYYAYL